MSEVFEITVQPGGERFVCQPQQSALHAMETQGKRCLPVGCRGGGCGLCKVRVLAGDYESGRVSCKHLPVEAREQGYALACRLFARSDLCIERYSKPCSESTVDQQQRE
ncbi:2Fe-2S iron-sulfur cluster binding domain-containing protein (plasmid) [Pseudomonas umsongensis]|uniref:Ferredoxin, plant-type n=3 Tax=Pseudomonas TaxID=286 RepID=FERN_PSEPU|nr:MULTISPECIES: 2Fe-2S iron-sulfur cluster binding domain-containing protein [Pseudomonas]P23263.1 RecName: Full=Ferredoxin, plant-type [Pseudomonas putida]AAA03926.1 Chloroplast-type ferredoxin homolog [Pseudomonas putida]AAA25898.1 unknown [Pseudomonas putida]AEV45886.1 chloroplast-type ferredoxin NahT [Pseudomonas sp. MC1]QFG27734.1 2Fe-2S iron-sulfur cluster binding domain-containing protein [Pseudomonas umsongensis]UPU95654.1 2Fe-2S iron-sulfur cluster binding domain-containing protein 